MRLPPKPNEADKHLICEKPLSTSLLSAEKILDCAAQNSRLIYENQMFLFHPQQALVTACRPDAQRLPGE